MGMLQRSPRDLRNYILWYSGVEKQYGSIAEFVRRERLRWEYPIIARDTALFNHPDDFKIIRNDWPYGVAKGITHLVIWSKVSIPIDPDTSLPTAESTATIENFLRQVFGKRLGTDFGEKLLWFKQKAEWQSVKSLDHIHVMVRGIAECEIDALTGTTRQQILSEQVAKGGIRSILPSPSI
jgi:hypothetical protein